MAAPNDPAEPAASEPGEPIAVDDESRDSLHIMPLAIVPLKTRGLKRARLVKNAQLETMVELFHHKDTGSGQIPPNLLDKAFPSDVDTLRLDMPTIEKICRLPSFDVYSLRIALRRLAIPIEDEKGLTLSAKKRAELTSYMRDFTRPLIQYVYGEGNKDEFDDISQILDRLRTPDRAETKERLIHLSGRLGVGLVELPQFLEDYGDIFLSLAYFKKILDEIAPAANAFLEWADGIKESELIRRDAAAMEALTAIKSQMSQTVSSIIGRFDAFDARSKELWAEMNSENFQSFRQLVTSNHASIGSVLCGLSLKLDRWSEVFPDHGGGPAKRADFLRNEIHLGLQRLLQEERTAARSLVRSR